MKTVFNQASRWLPGLLCLAIYGLLLTGPAAPAPPAIDPAMPEVMIVGCEVNAEGFVWVGALLTNHGPRARDMRPSVRIDLSAGQSRVQLFAAGVQPGTTARAVAASWVGPGAVVTGCAPAG